MVDSYPEYLNPFAEDVKPKTKLTIRNSFKEFRRSLRQSFRIKKKDEADVTLRQKPGLTGTFQRNPISHSSLQPEALPRSRFRERISHSPGSNPFEEEDGEAKTTIRRKGKKRAPLPPKSISSQHINDDRSEATGDSRWSLTSVDTDYSGSVYEQQSEDVKRDSIVEKFIEFNKDMKTLKDDTNNNVVSEEVSHNTENSNIPDLVVSCPSETTLNKDEESRLETKDNQETEIDTKNQESEESKDEKPQTLDDTKNEESEENKEEKPQDTKNQEENVSKEKRQEEDDDSDEEEIIVKDITNNMITEENKVNDAQIDDTYLYHEKKSLYIAGSKDDLKEPDNYTGCVSLYITGSCDDLDASNNNEVCNKTVTDENSNGDAVPTPKQRKNKLSKNILLGM